METALVAARKATSKGDFRLALAPVDGFKGRSIGTMPKPVGVGQGERGSSWQRQLRSPAGIRNNTLIVQQHTEEMLNLSPLPPPPCRFAHSFISRTVAHRRVDRRYS
jgi:hypothetical protein